MVGQIKLGKNKPTLQKNSFGLGSCWSNLSNNLFSTKAPPLALVSGGAGAQLSFQSTSVGWACWSFLELNGPKIYNRSLRINRVWNSIEGGVPSHLKLRIYQGKIFKVKTLVRVFLKRPTTPKNATVLASRARLEWGLSYKYCNLVTNEDLQNQVEKFWHLEQIDSTNSLSPEELSCEAHFIEHFIRNEEVMPEQRKYQKILWRSEPTKELSTYELNTVTYGTTAASYLAIRCLNQLALESDNSTISSVIKSDFYVDDLLSGANNKEEAVWLCQEVSSALRKGCFELRKWRPNEPTIIENVGKDEHPNLMDFGTDIPVKTLGLAWASSTDVLKFSIKPNLEDKRTTKRIILSETAQIFDPLGLLTICTVSAKLIIQKLWQSSISWDESVPLDLNSAWLSCKLWWKGPEWLSEPESNWPKLSIEIFNKGSFPQEMSSELKVSKIHTFHAINKFNLFDKYSSFSKLQRVLAYCFRFKANCLIRNNDPLTGPLSPKELESATLKLIYLAQRESFADEISDLEQFGSVSRKNRIVSLNPFCDDKGIIRVGGRLKQSQFEFYKKHPALLSPDHRLSVLLAEHEHRRLLHAGPQTVLASLREKIWIISGRNLMNKITRRCQQLQTRTKWKEKHPELLQPGVLVLIKDKNLPPLKWAMGRVMEVHKGADGVVRVVTLKTAQGVFKRPASKLCIIFNEP
ncbi:hypothetical protein NQ317_000317 [Molorchus minor]|uniref:DUF5641 domain-containing protein n=1 Tax=Molorchus minor TaxID=1323400 RepID=A0ABQ9J8L0_9CUCU|nr:hypothetical protein NQ317_000317 [Molorchus minor]